MLEDHSSRWSAAASPGGLIGLVLVILSGIAAVVSALGITDRIDLGLDDTVLAVALGLSTVAMLVLLYLLLACLTIRYRTDSHQLTIAWGLRSIRIPFAEIVAVAPATEVLGENPGGWQLYWPGYYVGKRNSDLGPIRVVSTLPPGRQVLIARHDGQIFAVSPEFPQLFMEEVSRGYTAAQSAVPSQDVESSGIASEPSNDAVPAGTATDVSPASKAEADPQRTQVASNGDGSHEHEPGPSSAGLPSSQPEPVPAFGYTPAEQSGQAVAVEEQPRRRSIHGLEAEIPELQDIDTARYRLPGDPTEPEAVFGVSAGQTALPSIGQTSGVTMVAEREPVEPSPPDAEGFPPGKTEPPIPVQESDERGDAAEVTPLEVVVHSEAPVVPQSLPAAEHTVPTQQPVLQPLPRVHRDHPEPVSPSLPSSLVRDPVAVTFAAVGLLATTTMAILILVQYQEIPSPLTLNWDVDGLPARIGEPQEIWLLPTMAALILIANIGVAWGISKFDQFAARMMLGSTLIVHLVIWVALLMILR